MHNIHSWLHEQNVHELVIRYSNFIIVLLLQNRKSNYSLVTCTFIIQGNRRDQALYMKRAVKKRVTTGHRHLYSNDKNGLWN